MRNVKKSKKKLKIKKSIIVVIGSKSEKCEKVKKKLKIKKSIIVVIGVQYAIQGVKMRL